MELQYCEDCQSAHANVHLTQIVNEKSVMHHLCLDCAKKRGISIEIEDDFEDEFDDDFDDIFEEDFEDDFDEIVGADSLDGEMENISMENISIDFSDFEQDEKKEGPTFFDVNVHEFTREEFKNKIEQATEGTRCFFCNTTFDEFEQTGSLGCPHCYTTFEQNVNETITDHPERKSISAGKKEDVTDLTSKLQQAVRDEHFELAAKLRDRIKALSLNGQ